MLVYMLTMIMMDDVIFGRIFFFFPWISFAQVVSPFTSKPSCTSVSREFLNGLLFIHITGYGSVSGHVVFHSVGCGTGVADYPSFYYQRFTGIYKGIRTVAFSHLTT